MNSNFKPNLLKELNCVQWWLLKFNQIGSFVQPKLSMLQWLHWELLTSIEYAFVFHGLSYWNCLCKVISDMKLKTYFSVIKELLTCSHCLIYMEGIIACCLNCFERSSICILNWGLLGCVELNCCHVVCSQPFFLVEMQVNVNTALNSTAAAVLGSLQSGLLVLSCGHLQRHRAQ